MILRLAFLAPNAEAQWMDWVPTARRRELAAAPPDSVLLSTQAKSVLGSRWEFC